MWSGFEFMPEASDLRLQTVTAGIKKKDMFKNECIWAHCFTAEEYCNLCCLVNSGILFILISLDWHPRRIATEEWKLCNEKQIRSFCLGGMVMRGILFIFRKKPMRQQ